MTDFAGMLADGYGFSDPTVGLGAGATGTGKTKTRPPGFDGASKAAVRALAHRMAAAEPQGTASQAAEPPSRRVPSLGRKPPRTTRRTRVW